MSVVEQSAARTLHREPTILPRFTLEQSWRGVTIIDRLHDDPIVVGIETMEDAREMVRVIEDEVLALGEGITVEGVPYV